MLPDNITIYELKSPLRGIEGLFGAQQAIFEYICRLNIK